MIRALCNDVAANCGLKIFEPGRDERVGPSHSRVRDTIAGFIRPPVVVSVTPLGSAVLKVRIPLELITIVGVISADELKGNGRDTAATQSSQIAGASVPLATFIESKVRRPEV